LTGALLGAGLFAGLVAGMFGVGGGTVIVPALYTAFSVLGLGGEGNLHTAVGSSMAVIVATALRSLGSHRGHGAVDETVLRAWTPWVALGGLIGAALAGLSSDSALGLIYAGRGADRGGLDGAGREQWRWRPTSGRLDAPGARDDHRRLFGDDGRRRGGFGGMLMTLYGRPIHQAVATASGFGVAIGVPAGAGLHRLRWAAEGRPPCLWAM
jgi:hypothetical protein